MQQKKPPIDTAHLRREAERHTRRLLALASHTLGAKIANPDIRFDLRGKTAGQVRSEDGRICVVRYNAVLLQRHPQEFLARTVPHETAHVVAFGFFGPCVQPHGNEWKAIMKLFGASPVRCHNYDVEGLETRHIRRFEYRCGCRTHKLTSIRHNRVRSGQVYLCRQCGQPLERDPGFSVGRASAGDRSY